MKQRLTAQSSIPAIVTLQDRTIGADQIYSSGLDSGLTICLMDEGLGIKNIYNGHCFR
jgi:hypothetical protein